MANETSNAIETVPAVPIPAGKRALPKDQAVAPFAQWYDEHQADQEATFTFTVSDSGSKMEAVIGERQTWD